MLITCFSSVLSVSYNQPKFCPNASWNPNAITFANSSTVGTSPWCIFVNTNNAIYATDNANSKILVWFNNSINPTRTISDSSSSIYSLFVTTNGDIYADYGSSNDRVDKWTFNANTSVPAMYFNSTCHALFIDINDTLYCSMSGVHKVVIKSLNTASNTTTTIGAGVAGNISTMLNTPVGIFVDINFDLYVADSDNNRIQRFGFGQLNGTTVAGDESLSITITLNSPSGIVLDADNYLFIVDRGNNRIVGSGPNGFRCLVGCSNLLGSSSNQLNSPRILSFDNYGNIFVTDVNNNRIQKFLLLTNSCGKYRKKN